MPLFWLDALSPCLFLHEAQRDRSPQSQIESRVGESWGGCGFHYLGCKGKRAYAWGSRIEAFPQLDSLLTKFHLPSNHLFFSLSQITFLYNDSIPLCSQQRLIWEFASRQFPTTFPTHLRLRCFLKPIWDWDATIRIVRFSEAVRLAKRHADSQDQSRLSPHGKWFI